MISAVASQSINDVFSTTYDNYRIVVFVKGSGNNAVNIRMRVAGADNSANNYRFGQQRFTAQGTTDNQSGNGVAQFTGVFHNITEYYGAQDLVFFNPFKTERTALAGSGLSVRSDFLGLAQTSFGGSYDDSISFTGFSMIASTGTITGSVSVYGFNK